MPTSSKRSIQIKVTLTPELHANLCEVARHLGQAPATLCSVWIGSACAQQLRALNMSEVMGKQLVDAIAPEVREQVRLASGARDVD